jgi:hypothetical protein
MILARDSLNQDQGFNGPGLVVRLGNNCRSNQCVSDNANECFERGLCENPFMALQAPEHPQSQSFGNFELDTTFR